MNIAIINLADGSCLNIYQDESPNQSKFGGPWGWPDQTVHVSIPDDLATSISLIPGAIPINLSAIKGQQDGDGNWSVVANS